MTRQRTLLAVLGIFMMIGVLTPAHAAGWSDAAYYDQAHYGQGQGNGNGGPLSNGNGGPLSNGNGGPLSNGNSSNGLFHFSPTTSKIAKLGVTATGAVLAGIFGSQFGTIGTVVGGAAGFFVSKWIGDKLFGSNSYPTSYTNGSQGQGFFSKIKDTILGHHADDQDNRTWLHRTDDQDKRWSQIAPGSAGNITDARKDFFTAMDNYKRAIASGSQADKESAKTAYDTARNAFFHFKSGN